MPDNSQTLEIVPITFGDANAFVEKYHRHHKPVAGMKFAIAVSMSNQIVGVALVGRPVSRMLDDGWTLEVNRVCVDPTARNACSKLYRSAWRISKELGYRKLITYTMIDECGSSLRGAAFRLIGERGGGNWNVPSRPRVDTDKLLRGQKLMWQMP